MFSSWRHQRELCSLLVADRLGSTTINILQIAYVVVQHVMDDLVAISHVGRRSDYTPLLRSWNRGTA